MQYKRYNPEERHDDRGLADLVTEPKGEVSEPLEDEAGLEMRHTYLEIEQTKGDLYETVEAIKERLDPDRLKTQAKDSLKQATWGKAEEAMHDLKFRAERETSGFLDTMKANPIPAALAVFGLGWLLLKRKETRQGFEAGYYGYEGGNYYPTRASGSYGRDWREGRGDQGSPMDAMHDVRRRAGAMAETAQERVGDLTDAAQQRANQVAGAAQDIAETAEERVGEMTGRAQETVSEFGDQARMQMEEMRQRAQWQARQAQGQFDRMLSNNPLALGALALGVGAAIGMMLPETETEREFMGDASRKVTAQAGDLLQDTVDDAKERVQQAAEAFQGEGRQQEAGS
jgi:ElaB/YqjD/DUF883 family membrane-anchored ribosome-binding protein